MCSSLPLSLIALSPPLTLSPSLEHLLTSHVHAVDDHDARCWWCLYLRGQTSAEDAEARTEYVASDCDGYGECTRSLSCPQLPGPDRVMSWRCSAVAVIVAFVPNWVSAGKPLVSKRLNELSASKMKLSGELVQPLIIGPVFKPVEDVSYNEREDYLGSWVAEVSIASARRA